MDSQIPNQEEKKQTNPKQTDQEIEKLADEIEKITDKQGCRISLTDKGLEIEDNSGDCVSVGNVLIQLLRKKPVMDFLEFQKLNKKVRVANHYVG